MEKEKKRKRYRLTQVRSLLNFTNAIVKWSDKHFYFNFGFSFSWKLFLVSELKEWSNKSIDDLNNLIAKNERNSHTNSLCLEKYSLCIFVF